MVDEKRHRLPQQSRRPALGHQQHVAVEARRHDDRTVRWGEAVSGQVFAQHQAIRLKLLAKQGEVEALESRIGTRRADQQGVALCGRPAWKIARPEISRKGFVAGHFGDGIHSEAQLPVGPNPTGAVIMRSVYDCRAGGSTDKCDPDGNARDHARSQKATPRKGATLRIPDHRMPSILHRLIAWRPLFLNRKAPERELLSGALVLG